MSVVIGNRIIKEFKRPDPAMLEAFRGIPSSNIGDMMNRLYNMHSDIRAYAPHVPLLGTAFTVKAPEGDNMYFHVAIEMAKPGDILVVDAGGSLERSLCGEMMFSEAISRGIGGFVVNGCIRDTDCLDRIGFPVYARGVTPQGPWKNGPGEINVPVCCGGQVVHPGDILVGDPDGIVVVPQEFALEIAQLARKKFDGEQERLVQYHSGKKAAGDKWTRMALDKGAVVL